MSDLGTGDLATLRPQPRRRGRPARHGELAVNEVDLLSLSFRAFAERGYEGTTLRELSKQLGVSHNLINVRFGKKADLWKRAVDWRLQTASLEVTAAFDEATDDETKLRHLIHRFCLWTTQHPDIIGLTHVEGRRNTWRMEYIAERFIIPFKQRLDALIAAVAAVRPVCNISTAALLSMLVQGAGFFFGTVPLQRRLGVGEELEPANAPREAARMADFLLAGLLPDQEMPVE
jgi:AcrR family transcriptional regulator